MAEKSRFVGCVFKQQGCRTGPLRTWLILRAGRIVKKYNLSVSQSLHSLTGSRVGRLDREDRGLPHSAVLPHWREVRSSLELVCPFENYINDIKIKTTAGNFQLFS